MHSSNLSQNGLSLMARLGFMQSLKYPTALHPLGYTIDAGLAYSIWWLEQRQCKTSTFSFEEWELLKHVRHMTYRVVLPEPSGLPEVPVKTPLLSLAHC